jgi:hypothetical protein
MYSEGRYCYCYCFSSYIRHDFDFLRWHFWSKLLCAGSRVSERGFFRPAPQHWRNATDKNCWAVNGSHQWAELSCKGRSLFSICEVPPFWLCRARLGNWGFSPPVSISFAVALRPAFRLFSCACGTQSSFSGKQNGHKFVKRGSALTSPSLGTVFRVGYLHVFAVVAALVRLKGW